MCQREAPAYRLDEAYSLAVFLHARTMRRCGWGRTGGVADPETIRGALNDAAETLDGLTLYQRHPYRRSVPEVPTVWRCGGARLLDYGGEGPPLLAIPSLVNRSTIMDLTPEDSPLRWMAGQGYRVFLLDWGAPGPAERGFDLGAYIDRRLVPALAAAQRLAEERPARLVGYCMGGPLMLALAARCPDSVHRIATLGAPWDFRSFPERDALRERRVQTEQLIAVLELLFGAVPSHMTQSFFAVRDMESGLRKFRRFARTDPASEAARRFVAVEDWLNDGVPLAAGVARECFRDWLVENRLPAGRWAPGGVPMHAADIAHPAMVVCAQRDSVVRRGSAEPLAGALPRGELLRADVGHIGMVVGEAALRQVWTKLRDFLR